MSAAVPGTPGDSRRLDDLVAALDRLDRLIGAAVEVTGQVDRTRAADQFRGLYVGRDDVARLLAQRPASSPVLLGTAADPMPAGGEPGGSVELERLSAAFDLTGFDLDLLLLAVAPEIDLRYERLFGFLADDLTKRRATVDLALDLLCASAAEKLRRRTHLSPTAPLLRHGLLSLHAAAGGGPPPTLLTHVLVPDEQVLGFLLGEPGPGGCLAGVAELVQPAAWDPADLAATALAAYLPRAGGPPGRPPRRLYLQGPPGRGQRAAAGSLAAAWGLPLLAVDLDQPAPAPTAGPAETAATTGSAGTTGPAGLVAAAGREALLRGALLYLEPLQALGDAAGPARRRAARLLAAHPGPIVLGGTGPWRPGPGDPTGVVTVACGLPGPAARRRAWQDEAVRLGLPLPPAGRDQLGDRFRLTAGQIAQAAETAAARLAWAAPGGPDAAAVPAALLESAREHGGAGLDRLARRSQCRHGWADLVLPPGEMAQLRELCGWVDHRQTVLATWGFGRGAAAGGGTTALFAGPPGTGKTLAAEVVAGHLGYDLCRIDLAQVVSKYIGETEKNLDAVFTAASDANVVLLFDEADALFGKRSAVQDAHDRYANLEIAYLLQKMEEFDGVVVLATNLRENLDQAFLRRLAFVVSFPFPDEATRRQIWQTLWPPRAPLGTDVSIDLLAAQIALAGGHLRNIAVAAAYAAAARGGPIGLPEVLAAARREYDKLGLVPPAVVREGAAAPDGAEPCRPGRGTAPAAGRTAAARVHGAPARGSAGVR